MGGMRRGLHLASAAASLVAVLGGAGATTTTRGAPTDGDLGASCLDDAVAPAARRSLLVDGVAVPLGVWRYEWDSARVLSFIYALLARDVLGYEVVWSGQTDTCGPGMLALAGCEAPTNYTDPQCRGGQGQTTHVLLEFWTTVPYTIEWVQTHYPASVPESLGSVGYASTQGLYVRGAQCSAAEAQGVQLQYYFFYNSAWFSPNKYFDNYGAIPKANLQPCSSSALSQDAVMRKVARWFPDAGGIVEGPYGLQATCPDGYWWLSPACWAQPSRCIPFITGGDGWYLQGAMQRAIAHSMPLAVAVAANDAMFASLPHTYRVMHYWWEPDRTFLDLSPVQIVFPPYNATEFSEGNYESNELQTLLTKNVYSKLSVVAPKAYKLAQEIKLDMSTMQSLLRELGPSGDGDVRGVACRWLREKGPIWRAWMPRATDCTSGYGLTGPAGNFVRDRAAADDCAPCGPGSFAEPLVDRDGSTRVCTACQPGAAQAQRGSDACEPCGAGYYQNETGQSLCKRCDKGTFATAERSSICAACPPGRTTDGTGFRSEADCQCAPGAYLANRTGECVTCGEGARCPGFGNEPMAIPGYQLMDVGEGGLSIFRCFGGAARCTGGRVGECADGREGVACALCRPGMTAAAAGTCRPCAAGDSAPFAAAFVAACALLPLVYRKTSLDDRAKQSHAGLFLLTNCSQVVLVLQVVGVFARLSMAWPEPLRSILAALRICTLDMQVLRMDCVGSFGPLARYFCTVALLPGALLYLTLVHAAAELVRHLRQLRRRRRTAGGPASNPLVGAMGTLFMALFIAVVTSTMAPLQCQRQPNGMWTMVQYESVLCWQGDEQSTMIGVGMCMMLLPCGFVAMVVCIISVFPTKMLQGDVRFLNTFTFLFHRVKPGTRWFVLGFLIRNLLVAFAPAIPQAFAQMLVLQVTMLGSLVLLLLYSPWRVPTSNQLDVLTHLGLVGFIYLATFFASDTDLQVVATIAAVTVAGGLSLMVVAALVSLVRLLLAPRKRYQWFLCHQKTAAGTVARLLKVALLESKRLKGDVFIDSDNLDDLDQLFDMVAHHTAMLVVLCSKEVLRRTWCLGEVVTACVNNIETLVIRFPDFTPPDDAFIRGIDSIIEVNILSEGGFSVLQARKALQWLRGLPHIAMPTTLDRQITAMLVLKIRSKHYSSDSLPSSHFLVHSHLEARTAILSDSNDREATAAALILQKLVVPLLDHDATLVPALFDELFVAGVGGAKLLGGVTVLLVLCTAGCFREPPVLVGLMCALHEGITATHPVVVRDDFRFPTRSFYAELEQNVAQLALQMGTSTSPGSLIKYVELMFKKIALPFNTMSTLQVLEGQAVAIERRLTQVASTAAVRRRPSASRVSHGMVAMVAWANRERWQTWEAEAEMTPIEAENRVISPPDTEAPSDSTGELERPPIIKAVTVGSVRTI